MKTTLSDKLPSGTVRRSEDYVKWHAPAPVDPAWEILQRALVKHPLLVIRAARQLARERKIRPAGACGWVLCAIHDALLIEGNIHAQRSDTDAAAYIHAHGVSWAQPPYPKANP